MRRSIRFVVAAAVLFLLVCLGAAGQSVSDTDPSGDGSLNIGLSLYGLPPSLDPFYQLLDTQPPADQPPADQAPGGQTPPAGQPPGQTPPPGDKTPEPYTKDEFAPWLQDLWRAEVIFVGSLPFTLFFSLEGYDFYRYASSGFSPAQAPWPLRPGAQIQYSGQEQFWLLISTVTLSALVSATDYLIGALSKPHENR